MNFTGAYFINADLNRPRIASSPQGEAIRPLAASVRVLNTLGVKPLVFPFEAHLLRKALLSALFILSFSGCATISPVTVDTNGHIESGPATTVMGPGCAANADTLQARLASAGVTETKTPQRLLIVSCSTRRVDIGTPGSSPRRTSLFGFKQMSELSLALYDAQAQQLGLVRASARHRQEEPSAMPTLIHAATERLIQMGRATE